jgi:hypothetical protein
VLVFTLISPLLEKAFPSVMKCYYKEITGDPCPFCGLTEDMSCTLEGDTDHQPVNTHFQLFLTVYKIAWAARILFTLLCFKLPGKTIPAIDTAFHLVLAAGVVYSV